MYTQNSIPLYTAKGEDSRSPLNFFLWWNRWLR